MKKELVKHVRDEFGMPFATLVAVKEDGEVRVGMSICNEKDSFSKQIGRDIARERAVLGRRKVFFDYVGPVQPNDGERRNQVPNRRTIDSKKVESLLYNEFHNMVERANLFFGV